VVSRAYFDGDVLGHMLLIPSQPDGRVTAVAKLVDDAVSVLLKSIANVNGMVAPRPVVVESFDVVDMLIKRAMHRHG
jgi:hypothetical protein